MLLDSATLPVLVNRLQFLAFQITNRLKVHFVAQEFTGRLDDLSLSLNERGWRIMTLLKVIFPERHRHALPVPPRLQPICLHGNNSHSSWVPACQLHVNSMQTPCKLYANSMQTILGFSGILTVLTPANHKPLVRNCLLFRGQRIGQERLPE